MPRPKRGRPPLAELSGNVIEERDGATKEELMKRAIEECENLERGLELRLAVTRAYVEERKLALQQEASFQLEKMPRCLREMPCVVFRANYGGDMELALRDAVQHGCQNLSPPSAATAADGGDGNEPANGDRPEGTMTGNTRTAAKRGRRRAQQTPATGSRPLTRRQAALLAASAGVAMGSTPMATPAPATALQTQRDRRCLVATPGTRRQPRPGEPVVSLNGSPLGIFDALSTPVIGGGAWAAQATAGRVSVRRTRAASRAVAVGEAPAPGGAPAVPASPGSRAADAGQEECPPGVFIMVETQDGKTLTLTAPEDVAKLPEGEKSATAEQIQGLQAQLSNMMQWLSVK